jgi:uncharacterized membrane protein YdjX (TVP38/TMEM64 family)
MRRIVSVTIALLVIGGAVAAWRTGYFDSDKLDAVRRMVRAIREVPFAPIIFVSAYALIVVLLLSTTVATIVSGAVFGFPGLALAWIGSLVGTAIAYLLGRYTGRRVTERFLGRHPLLERLRDHASTWDLMRLRVLPIAPFGVLPYLGGMTAVSLRQLLLATGIAELPTMAAYAYAGVQLGRAVEAGSSARQALVIAGVTTVVVVAVTMLPVLVKRLSGKPVT